MEARNDPILSVGILEQLWLERKTIILITGITILCGLIWALSKSDYKSEGLYKFGGPIPLDALGEGGKEPYPGISLANYNRYFAGFSMPDRFSSFVQEKNLEKEPATSGIKQILAVRGAIAEIVEPIYSFANVGSLGLIRPKDASNVLGLRIDYTSTSPKMAQYGADILGRYVMDSISYFSYVDMLTRKRQELRIKQSKIENTILELENKIEGLRQKAADLKQIALRNPDTAVRNNREVVTITEDTARFLSPATLVAATEVQITETEQLILDAKKEQMQDIVLLEFYDQVQKMADKLKSGETLLKSLDSIRDKIFEQKKSRDNNLRQVYNLITAENLSVVQVYLENSHFIVGPNLPRHSTMPLLIVLMVSSLAGLLFSLVYILTRDTLKFSHTKNIQSSNV